VPVGTLVRTIFGWRQPRYACKRDVRCWLGDRVCAAVCMSPWPRLCCLCVCAVCVESVIRLGTDLRSSRAVWCSRSIQGRHLTVS
jgi:hypothetical protein